MTKEATSLTDFPVASRGGYVVGYQVNADGSFSRVKFAVAQSDTMQPRNVPASISTVLARSMCGREWNTHGGVDDRAVFVPRIALVAGFSGFVWDANNPVRPFFIMEKTGTGNLAVNFDPDWVKLRDRSGLAIGTAPQYTVTTYVFSGYDTERSTDNSAFKELWIAY